MLFSSLNPVFGSSRLSIQPPNKVSAQAANAPLTRNPIPSASNQADVYSPASTPHFAGKRTQTDHSKSPKTLDPYWSKVLSCLKRDFLPQYMIEALPPLPANPAERCEAVKAMVDAAMEIRQAERKNVRPLLTGDEHPKAIWLLLNGGADAREWRDGNNNTTLHNAVENDSMESLQLLLTLHPRIRPVLDARNDKQDTPLTLAIHKALNTDKPNLDTVNLLLKHAANVDAPGRRGLPPLSIAARYHNLKLAQLLLVNGAKITPGFRDWVVNTAYQWTNGQQEDDWQLQDLASPLLRTCIFQDITPERLASVEDSAECPASDIQEVDAALKGIAKQMIDEYWQKQERAGQFVPHLVWERSQKRQKNLQARQGV